MVNQNRNTYNLPPGQSGEENREFNKNLPPRILIATMVYQGFASCQGATVLSERDFESAVRNAFQAADEILKQGGIDPKRAFHKKSA